jgi:hypothetical protein
MAMVVAEAANIRHGASIVNASSGMTHIYLERFQGNDHVLSLIRSWPSTLEGETVKKTRPTSNNPLQMLFR